MLYLLYHMRDYMLYRRGQNTYPECLYSQNSKKIRVKKILPCLSYKLSLHILLTILVILTLASILFFLVLFRPFFFAVLGLIHGEDNGSLRVLRFLDYLLIPSGTQILHRHNGI